MSDLSIVEVRATPERLRQLLDYDPETGKLTWKARDSSQFTRSYGLCGPRHQAAVWSAKNAGREAFTYTNEHGYRKGKVDRQVYAAHRVAWAIYYGEWPKQIIDHINGEKSDNRITNLRDVSNSVNMRNTRRHRELGTNV